jgi:pimeloyl-ACP methyl ester carboxylesterase
MECTIATGSATVPRLMELNHSRAGAGEPLVLLHGIGSHWQMWTPVLPMLTARHDVIAVDLPGFGDSPMPPPGTPPGLDSLCELVLGFLEQQGIQRPHVAGNSLGGMIALELARRGQARTVCALSPAGFFTPAETAVARGTLWLTVRLTRRLAPHADGLSGRPGQRKLLMNVFMAHPERLPRAEAAASMRAMAGAPWFDATLPAISPWSRDPAPDPSVPVTIGWGEKDRLLFPRQGHRAVAMIPSARLVPLIDCGHLPTFDDPQQVASLMLATTAAASD